MTQFASINKDTQSDLEDSTLIRKDTPFPEKWGEQEFYENYKNIVNMDKEPKTKIQELHDINGTIYALIEHLHSLDVPLGLVYQKLRETTTEIQGAITKLLSEEINESYNTALKAPELSAEQRAAIITDGKKSEIIVEYETKKR